MTIKAKDFPVIQQARAAVRAQFAYYYEMMAKKENKMKHTKGNLLRLAEAGEFDVIVQGCNCFCTMGSGIAKEIRETYPEAYEADLQTERGAYSKLGNYTYAVVPNKFVIVNAYTQFGFNRMGENKDLFEYTAFKLILEKLAYQFPTARFGFPYIGMGLAGGSKVDIMAHLESFSRKIEETGGSVTLVEFVPT